MKKEDIRLLSLTAVMVACAGVYLYAQNASHTSKKEAGATVRAQVTKPSRKDQKPMYAHHLSNGESIALSQGANEKYSGSIKSAQDLEKLLKEKKLIQMNRSYYLPDEAAAEKRAELWRELDEMDFGDQTFDGFKANIDKELSDFKAGNDKEFSDYRKSIGAAVEKHAAEQQQARQQVKSYTSSELENMYCKKTNYDCLDLAYLISLKGAGGMEFTVDGKQINAAEYMGRRLQKFDNNYAETLKREKLMCYGMGRCASALKSVETRQIERLLGEQYDIAALQTELEKANFTLEGWDIAIQTLCKAARQGKLNKEQLKIAKHLAESAYKRNKTYEADGYNRKLPVLHPSNRYPVSRDFIFECAATDLKAKF